MMYYFSVIVFYSPFIRSICWVVADLGSKNSTQQKHVCPPTDFAVRAGLQRLCVAANDTTEMYVKLFLHSPNS